MELDSRDKVKLVVAVICILAAGVMIAYFSGVFDKSATPEDTAKGIQTDSTGAPRGSPSRMPPGSPGSN
ncbi:MAG: hypothetical protein HRU70_14265 [Phycisphaeraceae bacterium]|nr:MAG: hypothetical protein HRU70_14265 [Phycisphaeraceae bacterium]